MPGLGKQQQASILGDEPSRGRVSNLGMRQGMMGVGMLGGCCPGNLRATHQGLDRQTWEKGRSG